MKVLILGANGMLGHALADCFADMHPLLLDKGELDISHLPSLRRELFHWKPTHVVNAAAYTNVDGAEKEQELALSVNADAVGFLTSVCAALGASLLHYSTDYVFDGKNPEGYFEHDRSLEAVNAYGASKLLGERMIQKFGERETAHPLHWYLVRTSWLYGNPGKNFVATILDAARKRPALSVVNDQFGRPTYARDLARATRDILTERKPSGIYHITNDTQEGGISWYDFAKEIVRRAADYEPVFRGVSVMPQSSKELRRPAARPTFGVLENSKLPPRRDWREALDDYLREYFRG